jgi:hypothetical protein
LQGNCLAETEAACRRVTRELSIGFPKDGLEFDGTPAAAGRAVGAPKLLEARHAVRVQSAPEVEENTRKPRCSSPLNRSVRIHPDQSLDKRAEHRNLRLRAA